MRSRAFCRPEDFDAWVLCPGKCALEEGEEDDAMRVETPPRGGSWLDISTVTGEQGALAFVDALKASEVGETAEIDIQAGQGESFLKIVALAALVRYSMLLKVTQVRLSGAPTSRDALEVTLPELYVFGAQVTEAAALSLRLRGESAALDHLVAGDVQCRGCLARYRCPAYQGWVGSIV